MLAPCYQCQDTYNVRYVFKERMDGNSDSLSRFYGLTMDRAPTQLVGWHTTPLSQLQEDISSSWQFRPLLSQSLHLKLQSTTTTTMVRSRCSKKSKKLSNVYLCNALWWSNHGSKKMARSQSNSNVSDRRCLGGVSNLIDRCLIKCA